MLWEKKRLINNEGKKKKKQLKVACITNFMGHNLAIIIMQNWLSIGFVWNRHKCRSSICIVWTLMSCALFRHESHMPNGIV